MVSSWAAPPAPAAAYRPSTAAMPAPIAAPTRHPLRSVDLIRKSDIGPSCNATKNPSPNPMIAAFMVPDARSWRKGSRQIQPFHGADSLPEDQGPGQPSVRLECIVGYLTGQVEPESVIEAGGAPVDRGGPNQQGWAPPHGGG